MTTDTCVIRDTGEYPYKSGMINRESIDIVALNNWISHNMVIDDYMWYTLTFTGTRVLFKHESDYLAFKMKFKI